MSQKLLVISYEYPPIGGGGSPIVFRVSRELAAMGMDVDLITMRFRGLPSTEIHDNLRIFRVPCLRSNEHICYMHEMVSFLPGAFFKALSLARSTKYDLVHTHFIVPSAVVAYLLKKTIGLNYVVTAHGSDVQGYNPDRFQLAHKLIGSVWRLIVRNAVALTSPSNFLKGLIESQYRDSKRIEVIPNAIDTKWLVPGQKKPSILVVTRLFKRKGVQDLLLAINELPPEYEVNIVGDGPYLPTLKTLAKESGHAVRFWGWISHDDPKIKELYSTAEIFVFPSRAENFPVSLLEAMLAKTAIVASNADACLEVLGDTARYFEPRDTEQLGTHIAELINDSAARNALAESARARALDIFSWESVGPQYYNLLTQLSQER